MTSGVSLRESVIVGRTGYYFDILIIVISLILSVFLSEMYGTNVCHLLKLKFLIKGEQLSLQQFIARFPAVIEATVSILLLIFRSLLVSLLISSSHRDYSVNVQIGEFAFQASIAMIRTLHQFDRK